MWLNPWYWLGYYEATKETEETKETKETKEKKKNIYQVADGIEIDTSRIYLCPELLALKKKSLKEVIPAPPSTPESKRIERTLKTQKKRLRKKRRRKNLYSDYRDVVRETG